MGILVQKQHGLSTEPKLITEQYETCRRSHFLKCPRTAETCPVLFSFTQVSWLPTMCTGSSPTMGEEQNDWQFPSEDSQFIIGQDRLQIIVIQRRQVNAVVWWRWYLWQWQYQSQWQFPFLDLGCGTGPGCVIVQWAAGASLGAMESMELWSEKGSW